MNTTVQEVLEFVRENDVKFIRLAFCDLFGMQKNISIMPNRLEDAFQNGVSFDAYAVEGFSEITHSDLFLFPDPTTLNILPWRPQQGRVVRFYCSIKHPDGTPFLGDTRAILKDAVARAKQMGYDCKLGAECEFYLFKADEIGDPTMVPMDQGGYLDIAPLDKGENIRREICLGLEEMGIIPESSHHEQGPGQNEIDFLYSDPLSSADHFMTFKALAKAIAGRNGLFASFMPKPISHASGSGLHVNLSLHQKDIALFNGSEEEHRQVADAFTAGIMAHIDEITTFLNPLVNSYDRLGEFEAPKYISWSPENRSQLIRIPAAVDVRKRIELRSPDPSVNPYLAFGLILHAGLDGIEKKIKLPDPTPIDLYKADQSALEGLSALPSSLEDALKKTNEGKFVPQFFKKEFLKRYTAVKKDEIEAYRTAEDKEEFYQKRYFSRL